MEYIYGYARVSSKEQNLDRQLIALKEFGVDERNIITDKFSGKTFERNGYLTLKNSLLRKGDTLVIKELDRLGRNMDMIKAEWQELENKGINIIVIDTPILNTKGKSDLEKKLISNIVFELLTYLAEKERLKTHQRQAEGIAAAKAQGKKFGRPSIPFPDMWEWYYTQWRNGDIKAVTAMELLGLKKNTFYKLAKQYDECNNR